MIFPIKFAKIGCWNIHGAYYKVNNFKVNKLQGHYFMETLNNHDILCLQETLCGPGDGPADHLTQFASIPHCRKISSNNRHFGGMLLLIRKTIRKGVKVRSVSDKDILGISLDKDFFGLPNNITVWFVYAPPISSPYTASRDEVLLSLQKKMTDSTHPIILGDLNGKTNTVPDTVDDAEDAHSPINDITTYSRDKFIPRHNQDENKMDKQGSAIIEMCKSNNLRILNGRMPGDRWGSLTRFPINRLESPSVLDYCISHTEVMKNIDSFKVHPISDLSDHCCISFLLLTNIKLSEGPPQMEDGMTPLHHHFSTGCS